MSYLFEYPHRVVPSDIDALNHVNNLVYLNWFLKASEAHSEAVGWPFKRYIEEGAGWVIRRHEIDYLAPAFLDDELIVMTWVERVGKSSAVRQYKVVRVKDERVMAKGSSVWVWLDYKTGSTRPIPSSMRKVFSSEETLEIVS